MRAGLLRHRLEVQRPTNEAIGDAGNPEVTYTTEAPVWGSIVPLSVAERLSAGQVEAQATHVITIRHHKTIGQTWRFKFGQRYFAIASILPIDSRPIEMQIMVREVV